MKFNIRMKQNINVELRFNEDLRLYVDFKNVLSRIKRDYSYDVMYNCTMNYLPRIGEKIRISMYNGIIPESSEIKDIIHCMCDSNIVKCGAPIYETEGVEFLLSNNTIIVDGLDYLKKFTRIFIRETGMFVPPTTIEDWISDIQLMKKYHFGDELITLSNRRWKSGLSNYNTLLY